MFSVTAISVLPLKDYPRDGIFPPSTARSGYSGNPETSQVCFSVFIRESLELVVRYEPSFS